MKDLIARLESAEEGSRELSDEVLLALGYRFVPEENVWRKAGCMDYGGWLDPSEVVDHALALVPEKYGWRMDSETDRKGRRPMALLYRNSTGTSLEVVKAATPALALCAAILRTKEQS